MPIHIPSFAVHLPSDHDNGFALAASSVGPSQKASLGGGIAFLLLLAATSLASVSAPLVLHGPDWVQGTAPEPLAAGRRGCASDACRPTLPRCGCAMPRRGPAGASG